MCEICDGRTEQQLFERMRGRIDARGWSLQGVEPGPQGSGWVYTIGLIETFGNPELVITGGDLQQSAALLNEIGERISRGLHVDVGDILDLDGYVVEFGEVHASYLAHGLCASWERCYAQLGERPGPLRVLQVVVPLTQWCDHCDRKRRCLATPGARGFGGPLNRAARRARTRRQRRS
jgi:Domain of unknown function (DUF4262)